MFCAGNTFLLYGVCQTGCNTVWVACVSAAGGVAGYKDISMNDKWPKNKIYFSWYFCASARVSTGGAGVPAAIVACNTSQGTCMAACAGVTLGLLWKRPINSCLLRLRHAQIKTRPLYDSFFRFYFSTSTFGTKQEQTLFKDLRRIWNISDKSHQEKSF